jgi:hypothetical protein
MNVTMMLCDHAQVAGGKLFIAGGGWSATDTPTAPSAIALIISVPWDRTNSRIQFALALTDQDGRPVSQMGPQGTIPTRIEGQVEVGRPPGVKPGSPIDVPLAFNVQSMLLDADARYTWVLTLDGEQQDSWTLSFATRPRQAPTGGYGPSDIGFPRG